MLIFNGRPLVLTDVNECPAILEMWFPGSEGGNAAADLLFGDSVPCGKLTMGFPKHVGQCPIYYNHPNTGRPKRGPDEVNTPYSSNYIGCGNLPLYSFGHGLSYSKFVYEDLQLSANEMTAEDTVTVSITVRNDSAVAGKETVMLYMRDMVASNARPIQQMIAFEKVDFAPWETKTVTFQVKESMLRFWNNDHAFVSEPGVFKISTGYADHLILTQELTLR
jgi:beta-glucosidase